MEENFKSKSIKKIVLLIAHLVILSICCLIIGTSLVYAARQLKINTDFNLTYEGSDGLIYEYVSDKNAYKVVGINDPENTRSKVVIPDSHSTSEHGTLPVVAVENSLGDATSFANRSSITSLTIGQNVETLEKGVFSGLNKLTQLNFNSTKLQDYFAYEDLFAEEPLENNMIFYGAGIDTDGLVINFGENVTHIPGALFSPVVNDAFNIAGFYISSAVPYLGSPEEADIIKVLSSLAVATPKIKEINFNNVQSIGAGAFCGNFYLKQVVIPDYVTTVDAAAFTSCSNYWDDIYPVLSDTSGLEGYAKYFEGQTGLTSLTIGENVKTIEIMAYGCLSGLTTVNYNAIKAKDLVTEEELIETIKSSQDPAAAYGPFILSGSESGFAVNIGPKVEHIPGGLFCSVPDAGMVVESALVRSVDISAVFSACAPNIREINFNSNLKSIGPAAFTGVYSLQEVSIPEGVTSIGSFAFAGCSNATIQIALMLIENDSGDFTAEEVEFFNSTHTGLKSLTIPSTVEHMGMFAVGHSLALEDIILESSHIANLEIEALDSNPDTALQTLFSDKSQQAASSLFADVFLFVGNGSIQSTPEMLIQAGGNVTQIPAIYLPTGISSSLPAKSIINFLANYAIAKTDSDKPGYDKYARPEAVGFVNNTPYELKVYDMAGNPITTAQIGQHVQIKLAIDDQVTERDLHDLVEEAASAADYYALVLEGITYNEEDKSYIVTGPVTITYTTPIIFYDNTCGLYEITDMEGNVLTGSEGDLLSDSSDSNMVSISDGTKVKITAKHNIEGLSVYVYGAELLEDGSYNVVGDSKIYTYAIKITNYSSDSPLPSEAEMPRTFIVDLCYGDFLIAPQGFDYKTNIIVDKDAITQWTILRYVGTSSSVTVPSSILGHNVIIGPMAFITLNDIDQWDISAAGLYGLAIIFTAPTFLIHVGYSLTQVTDITISGGVALGSLALSGCAALENIVFCKDVVGSGEGSDMAGLEFVYCTSLKNITIENEAVYNYIEFDINEVVNFIASGGKVKVLKTIVDAAMSAGTQNKYLHGSDFTNNIDSAPADDKYYTFTKV